MKDFAKSIVCNTKAGNSNKAEIIEKKKKEGATLKVDNGQKLEFSDGSTYVKTSFSDDYREAHNYTGNKKVGNAKDKNGKELKIGDIVAVKTSDPSLNHGKIVRISGDQVSVDVTGDDDIWTTPARLTVKMGNSKVGNYGPDQAEAREFQQALRPIKSLIEEAGTAIYASSKEAISDLQKAKQEIDRAISWAKNL